MQVSNAGFSNETIRKFQWNNSRAQIGVDSITRYTEIRVGISLYSSSGYTRAGEEVKGEERTPRLLIQIVSEKPPGRHLATRDEGTIRQKNRECKEKEIPLTASPRYIRSRLSCWLSTIRQCCLSQGVSFSSFRPPVFLFLFSRCVYVIPQRV